MGGERVRTEMRCRGMHVANLTAMVRSARCVYIVVDVSGPGSKSAEGEFWLLRAVVWSVLIDIVP